jgi:putative nucleotidyltransferase with HDIG domain
MLGLDYILLEKLRKYHAVSYYHSLRVSVLCFQLGKYLGLDVPTCNTVMRAGLLHDIGKINVPIAILSYPGKLTNEQHYYVRRHVDDGVELLKKHAYDNEIIDTIYAHHEREDGRGYPRGVAEINDLSRILAICDVFDAIREVREYSKSVKKERVLSMMLAGEAGSLHNPFIHALGIVINSNMISKVY